MVGKQPVLIVVNGIRGSGKTTLAGKLAKDISLPCVDKDTIKEFLADTLHVSDVMWSKLLGRIAGDTLLLIAERLIENGESLIIESAFHHQFARPKFQRLAQAYPVRIVEIYCTAEASVRINRYIARTHTGTRHPIHVDAQHHDELRDDEKLGTYAPLDVGTVLEVDTTHFTEDDYQRLLAQVKGYL